MEKKLPEKASDQIIKELDKSWPLSQKKKVLTFIGFFVMVAILVVLGWGFGKEISEKEKIISKAEEKKQEVPSPTPAPFYEMTIPYLRERSYNSEIVNLEQISRNPNYTSYLTSYDSDGLMINAQLTIPTSDRPIEGFPAIIFVHGYIPPSSYQTLSNYSSYVDYLASNGFVVFKIDLRGHGSSEGEATGAYYSSDYIVDVLNARAALQNFEEVNVNAIGIWGHSMAGNVTLRALAAKPDIPAIVIWAGAVYTYEDWEEYGIQDGSYRPPSNQSERQRERDRLFAIHGRFDKNSPFWSTVAATNYLNEIKGAVSLNHAVNDDVVNIGYSRNLATLLKENSVEYELNEYSSGGHNISGSAFNEAMGNTVSFFRNYLQ